MSMLRSISFGLFAASMLSFLVAYECYQRALKNAQLIAERLEFIQVESVGVPMGTYAGFTMGVTFFVASVICYLDYRKQSATTELKPDLPESNGSK